MRRDSSNTRSCLTSLDILFVFSGSVTGRIRYLYLAYSSYGWNEPWDDILEYRELSDNSEFFDCCIAFIEDFLDAF